MVFSRSKRKRLDVDEACPFPPRVDLPGRGRFPQISASIFTDPRFVASALLVAGIMFIFGLSLAPPSIVHLQTSPPIWNATIPQGKQYPLYSNTVPWVPKYKEVRTWNGDLILQGDQVLLIENCSYSIQGSVLVKDHAKLILKNADINLKQKTGWVPTDPVPNSYNMMFMDESELQADNSTVYSLQSYTIQLGFYNSSTCHVTDSNVTSISFFGYDNTSFSFEKAELDALMMGENSSINLNACKVDQIIPDTYDNGSYTPIKIGKLKLDATDSSIIALNTFYLNSTIIVDKPTSGHYESWNSFRDLAPGGKGFNITLTRSEVSGLTIMSEGSYLEITNSNDLDYAYDLWGRVKVVNSSIPSLAIGGGGIIEGCRIGMLNIIDGDYQVSRSRIADLFLHHNHGNVNLTQVKTGRITGHDFNCSLTGDLTVENETASVPVLWGNCQVKRSYPIQVLNGDRAAVGIDLRLYNETGDLLWSGRTDGNGRANVDVTFYQKVSVLTEVSPNFSDTLRLVASGVSGDKEVPLRFTGDTPVILSFPLEQEKPMWAQGWFVEVVSVIFAMGIAILYLTERMRKGHGNLD